MSYKSIPLHGVVWWQINPEDNDIIREGIAWRRDPWVLVQWITEMASLSFVVGGLECPLELPQSFGLLPPCTNFFSFDNELNSPFYRPL